MKVLQVYMRNSLRNFNYIVYSEVNDKAIFIDPLDIDKTLPVARDLNLKPTWLLNTHGHHDHVRDNAEFLKETGGKLVELKDGEKFWLSDREAVQAIHTPGHVKEHYCFLLETDGVSHGLISGDTLFNAGVGNCKNGGNVEELYESVVNKLAPLPDSLTLYPSHDYMLTNLLFAKSVEPENRAVEKFIERRKEMDMDEEFILTTLGEEKEINPFLRLEKLRLEKPGGKFKDKTPKEIFFELRSLRDRW